MRLPPALPRSLRGLTALGLLISEPSDLEVGGWKRGEEEEERSFG
jgi:hypothetical protein